MESRPKYENWQDKPLSFKESVTSSDNRDEVDEVKGKKWDSLLIEITQKLTIH